MNHPLQQPERRFEGLISLDGTIHTGPEEASTSLLDQSYLYGAGEFSTLRTVGGWPYRLKDHIARLARGVQLLELSLPSYSLERDVKKWVHVTVRRFCRDHEQEARVRVTLSGADHFFPVSGDTTTWTKCSVIVTPLVMPPPAAYRDGVATVSIRNLARQLPEVKSTSFLASHLGTRQAAEAGAFEGVFVDPNELLLEGCTSNIFALVDGTLLTPQDRILPGVTRKEVLEICGRLSLPVETGPLSLERFFGAEEAFLTGTTKGVVPVVRHDGRQIGSGRPGPVTMRLMSQLYHGRLSAGREEEGHLD